MMQSDQHLLFNFWKVSGQQIKVVLSILRITFTEKRIEIKKLSYENELQKEIKVPQALHNTPPLLGASKVIL